MSALRFIEAVRQRSSWGLINCFCSVFLVNKERCFESEDATRTFQQLASLSTILVSLLSAGCSFHSTQWTIARTLFAEDPIEIRADWQLYRSEKMVGQLYALLDGGNTVFTDGVGLFLVFDGWDIIQSEDAYNDRVWRMIAHPSDRGAGCLQSEACKIEYMEFSIVGQLLGSESLECTAWLVSSNDKSFFKTCQAQNRVYDYKISLDDSGSIFQIDWSSLGGKWRLRKAPPE